MRLRFRDYFFGIIGGGGVVVVGVVVNRRTEAIVVLRTDRPIIYFGPLLNLTFSQIVNNKYFLKIFSYRIIQSTT